MSHCLSALHLQACSESGSDAPKEALEKVVPQYRSNQDLPGRLLGLGLRQLAVWGACGHQEAGTGVVGIAARSCRWAGALKWRWCEQQLMKLRGTGAVRDARTANSVAPHSNAAGELAFDKLAQSLHRGCSHPDATALDAQGKGSGNCLGFAAHDKSGGCRWVG